MCKSSSDAQSVLPLFVNDSNMISCVFAFARLSTVQPRRMGDVLAFPIRTCLLPWPWSLNLEGQVGQNRFLCQTHPHWPAASR